MSIHQWTITEAKAKFSEIIKKAHKRGPQTITRRGRTVAVVTAAKEERKADRKAALPIFCWHHHCEVRVLRSSDWEYVCVNWIYNH